MTGRIKQFSEPQMALRPTFAPICFRVSKNSDSLCVLQELKGNRFFFFLLAVYWQLQTSNHSFPSRPFYCHDIPTSHSARPASAIVPAVWPLFSRQQLRRFMVQSRVLLLCVADWKRRRKQWEVGLHLQGQSSPAGPLRPCNEGSGGAQLREVRKEMFYVFTDPGHHWACCR